MKDLKEAAEDCHACPLYKTATHVVFGEGSSRSKIVIIGEQPGDKEDLAGEPFVGPAGSMLDYCLEKAGIPRNTVYVTNAVKHFKWTPQGKIRLHKKPSAGEVKACKPWLEAELGKIKPDVIIALGATAALSVLGKATAITKERGKVMEQEAYGSPVIVSWHPSAILRSIRSEDTEQKREQLIEDLKLAAKVALKKPQ
ncbi:UdgX family uracil-DNA binding protein [Bdellovibrio sp. 22V]|uniref:UdgX family uracil-DNA binding protein n=1 Tax=Bdellovibrio TaxID=958 RepID=UPI002542B3D0|nr:UdgX family uracil-DNA binding protein [Bdellovibrio sp. 22V]WII71507.1 UdgX family uracil-DNA binding protein [Bdellovibrio sp. 22V]